MIPIHQLNFTSTQLIGMKSFYQDCCRYAFSLAMPFPDTTIGYKYYNNYQTVSLPLLLKACGRYIAKYAPGKIAVDNTYPATGCDQSAMNFTLDQISAAEIDASSPQKKPYQPTADELAQNDKEGIRKLMRLNSNTTRITAFNAQSDTKSQEPQSPRTPVARPTVGNLQPLGERFMCARIYITMEYVKAFAALTMGFKHLASVSFYFQIKIDRHNPLAEPSFIVGVEPEYLGFFQDQFVSAFMCATNKPAYNGFDPMTGTFLIGDPKYPAVEFAVDNTEICQRLLASFAMILPPAETYQETAWTQQRWFLSTGKPEKTSFNSAHKAAVDQKQQSQMKRQQQQQY